MPDDKRKAFLQSPLVIGLGDGDVRSWRGLGKEQEEDASGDRVGQDPRVPDVDFLLLVPLSDESPGPCLIPGSSELCCALGSSVSSQGPLSCVALWAQGRVPPAAPVVGDDGHPFLSPIRSSPLHVIIINVTVRVPLYYCAWHVSKVWECEVKTRMYGLGAFTVARQVEIRLEARADLSGSLYEKDKTKAIFRIASFHVKWSDYGELILYLNKNYFGEDDKDNAQEKQQHWMVGYRQVVVQYTQALFL
ncbi:hypothetical protein EDD21DRAFT_408352 [Dissophora ornata]|nr:hypothetical protein EDD21DRAFT_408352 [Dissophora ornata]